MLLRDEKLRGIPAGITVDSNATTLYAANVWGHSVSRVRLAVADGAAIIDELLLGVEAPASAPAPAPMGAGNGLGLAGGSVPPPRPVGGMGGMGSMGGMGAMGG